MGVGGFKYLNKFLDDYPSMSINHCSIKGVHLSGKFNFTTCVANKNKITDSYKLEIIIPENFPHAIPILKEIGGKIPRNGNYHVNPDGSLCLGSPLRLLLKINNSSDLSTFIDKCLVPYLYAISYKLKYGGNWIFGELAHGEEGIIDDYSNIFGLKERSQVVQALNMLGVKKRIANKNPCPCGCGKKLGNCSFHNKLNKYRELAPTSWFKKQKLNIVN